jgi:RimJ/RimL family protein N-acetyltransferase
MSLESRAFQPASTVPSTYLPTADPFAQSLVIVVRPYELGDAASLRALLADRRIADAFFGKYSRGPEINDYMQAAWAEEEPRDGVRLVACVLGDSAIAGAARLDGDELAYLTAPAYWRRGVGRRLVDEVCGLTREDRTLIALVARENRPSAALLCAMGFRFAGLCPPTGGAFWQRARLRYVWRRRAR